MSDKLLATHLAPLRARWRADYPLVEETIPESLPGPSFLTEGTWPLPRTRYWSDDSEKAIEFESDRIMLSWSFADSGEYAYPGFGELSAELHARFTELRESVRESGGPEMEPLGVECEYVNILETVTVDALVRGVMTGWTPDGRDSGTALSGSGYIGLRADACTDASVEGCRAVLAIDGDRSGTRPTSLQVSVVRDFGEGLYEDHLQTAHAEVLQIFLSSTSEQLHEEWGRLA